MVSDLSVASYAFDLDPAAIAQRPPARRGDSRMLVVTSQDARDAHVSALPELLAPGDLLIVNDTRVLPARLYARKASGGKVELLLLRPLGDGSWEALIKPSSRVAEGAPLTLRRRGDETTGPQVIVGGAGEGASRVVRAAAGELADLAQVWGEMPLPPYIRREAPQAADRERYQCLWAKHDGAVAAPTAGLHFDDELLRRLDERGVERRAVTLHVGAGTFRPLHGESLDDNELHVERWAVPTDTAAAVAAAEARGSRVVAVGTTCLRSLESWHRAGRPADGGFRETRLFLRPDNPPQLACGLLTNFHLPRSSLVVLVASLLGRERTLNLYGRAAATGYRFYSYGDCMVLL